MFKVLREYRKAGLLDRLSGKRRKLRQDFRRLNARRRAVYSTCDKISALASLYHGYKDRFIGGDEPFMHQRNWNVTRAKFKKSMAK